MSQILAEVDQLSVEVGLRIGEEVNLADLVSLEIRAMDTAIEEVGAYVTYAMQKVQSHFSGTNTLGDTGI